MRARSCASCAGCAATPPAPATSAPGMRFHYLPDSAAQPPDERRLGRVREHRPVVPAASTSRRGTPGMAALPHARRALLRQWTERAIAGYWTHGGYMNWDTGLGFERWHQAKKLGLTQQALIGIAQADAAAALGRRTGKWAKWMLDRGLTLLRASCPCEPAGCPTRCFFKLYAVPQTDGERPPRRRAHAGQRRARGRGRARAHARAAQPPALYAFDPDTGRLAVTTPALQHGDRRRSTSARSRTAGSSSRGCSTASRTSRPTSAAGRPRRSGCWCRTAAGRQVLSSQVGRSTVTRGVTPLRLTRGARRRRRDAPPPPAGRAFAGPFTDLRATGTSSTRRAGRADEPPLHAAVHRDELVAEAGARQRAG